MIPERDWSVGDRFTYHSYYTKQNGFGTVIRVEGIKVVAVLDDFPNREVIFHSKSPYVIPYEDLTPLLNINNKE